MQILGYGEDGLTLWALQNKLGTVLYKLRDVTNPSACQVFYRPSFGRSGGETSSQFGEFDFVILAEACLYLGESKWDKSSKRVRDGVLQVPEVQRLRHQLFRIYVEQWMAEEYKSWERFAEKVGAELERQGVRKRVPSEDTRLTENLRTVLRVIKNRYVAEPRIQNVFLYLYDGQSGDEEPEKAPEDFELVAIDYAEAAFDNFVRL